MITDFDEKGKIFTNIITKNPIAVHIQTLTHLIKGNVHIRPDERLKDELNQNETFIAVTDAQITDQNGSTQKCGFLAVNRSNIIWILQESEIIQRKNE
ncbi:MAG: hypothetical protein JEZ06_16680 [Anaerolineaceae bacterium]|nr:hypothetical protein [Anaerolineaceae bacterium]